MTESRPGPSGPGSVVLDIGDDVGALIIITPAVMAGEEIHVSPVRDPAGLTHAVVRERRARAGLQPRRGVPGPPGRGVHDLAGSGPRGRDRPRRRRGGHELSLGGTWLTPGLG